MNKVSKSYVYKLTNEQYNSISMALEQISGLNVMAFLAIQDAFEESNPAMTAHVLIREKYEQAKAALESAEVK